MIMLFVKSHAYYVVRREMKAATIVDIFSRFVAGVPQISEKSRVLLIASLKQRLGDRELDGDNSDPLKRDLHFQVLRAELVKIHWVELDAEERVYLFFPAARQVGEEVELPKRGKGKILWRELTDRLGLKMCFELSDGSKFVWEFFD